MARDTVAAARKCAASGWYYVLTVGTYADASRDLSRRASNSAVNVSFLAADWCPRHLEATE